MCLQGRGRMRPDQWRLLPRSLRELDGRLPMRLRSWIQVRQLSKLNHIIERCKVHIIIV